jgi:Xaa-Pro aminopeptidase
MTRCLQINKEKIKDKKYESFEEIYSLLQKVTNHTISWAKPGMKVSELDKKVRTLLGEYEPYFTHSLGHGVGIDIHESPSVSSKSDEILQEGMVITIEPGIYIPGKYGARYEEMILVSEK